MYYIEPEDFPLLDEVKEALNKFLKYLHEERDFSVSFVSDEEIRELNKEYRDIDAPTDILTFRLADSDIDFPLGDEEDSETGDIFISMESMRRNAKEFGVSENEELRRLLLHGLLHLRGLDHKSNDFSTEPMLVEQEKILKEIFK